MLARVMFSAIFALAWADALALAETPYVNIEDRLAPEQMHATGLDSLSPAQLELLNQLLRDDFAAIPKTEAAREIAQKPDAAPPDTSPPATVTSTPRPVQSDRSRFIGFSDEPIKSRLKGRIDGWAPGTVFELENNQKWKVLKGSVELPQALESPEIVVVPGIAGRWFLQVVEDMPKARVYRIE
jgi:hypothetical protein